MVLGWRRARRGFEKGRIEGRGKCIERSIEANAKDHVMQEDEKGGGNGDQRLMGARLLSGKKVDPIPTDF